jgi:hypothetical protein
VARTEEALRASHDLIRSNPARGRSILPKYTPTTPDVASGVALYDYWSNDQIDHASLVRLIDLYVKHGIIGRSVEYRSLLLPR